MNIAALGSSVPQVQADPGPDDGLATGEIGLRNISYAEEDTRQVTILLMPGFCFYTVTTLVEALAMANRVADRKAYRWRFVSADERHVLSSAGIALEADGHVDLDRLGLSSAGRTDMLFVPSDLPPASPLWASVRRYVLDQAELGALVAGIGRGVFLLADAGLLEERRCAVHWQHLKEMKQRFTRVEADCHLYEHGETLLTCAGQTAVLDFILSVVRHDLGAEVASGLCDQHVVEQVRPARHRQRQPETTAVATSNPKLAAVVTLMRENPAPPLQLATVARRVGMSRRQIERLFELEGQEAPTRFYLHVRLEKAQQMLRRTALPVVDIGMACGFVSASHFSKCYRKRFGHSPKQEREGERL